MCLTLSSEINTHRQIKDTLHSDRKYENDLFLTTKFYRVLANNVNFLGENESGKA